MADIYVYSANCVDFTNFNKNSIKHLLFKGLTSAPGAPVNICHFLLVRILLKNKEEFLQDI